MHQGKFFVCQSTASPYVSKELCMLLKQCTGSFAYSSAPVCCPVFMWQLLIAFVDCNLVAIELWERMLCYDLFTLEIATAVGATAADVFRCHDEDGRLGIWLLHGYLRFPVICVGNRVLYIACTCTWGIVADEHPLNSNSTLQWSLWPASSFV